MPTKSKRGSGKRRGHTLAARKRQAEAVALRIKGLSFPEIAERLGYSSHTGAIAAIDAAFERISAGEQRDVVKLRNEMDARYLALLKPLWPKAQKGSLEACEMVLKILADLRKLWALDKLKTPKEEASEALDAILADWEPVDQAANAPALPATTREPTPAMPWESWTPVEEDGEPDDGDEPLDEAPPPLLPDETSANPRHIG